MTNAVADALLIIMGDVHANADVSFDLDSAIRILESTNAMLQEASSDERQHLATRADALAAQGGDRERVEFFKTVAEDLRADP
jgi:hypothetical protein